jgi:hypothetical protein
MRARKLALVALLAGAAVASCGGDDDENGASAGDLKKQLLPESLVPGFKVERSFEWDNAIDAVHEGFPLPEDTPLSRAVDVYEDAEFKAGAGNRLVKGSPFAGPGADVSVLEFGSEEGAGDAQDFLHQEDLKQPCFGACAVDPREMAVDGIPGAKGVQRLPAKNPPPDAPPPFAAFHVEFTIGPRLYVVTAIGEPKRLEKGLVLDAARRLYAQNK